MESSRTPATMPILTVLRADLPHQSVDAVDRMAIVSHLADELRTITHATRDRFPRTTVSKLPCLRIGRTALPLAGYTFWDPHRHQWVMRLNTQESPEDRRFTLLHEFAHIIWHLHSQYLFAGLTPEQRQSIAELAADVFAGEALMPTSRVLRVYQTGCTSPLALARHFGVSPATALWRLEQIGLPHPSDPRSLIEPSIHPRTAPLMEDQP